MEFNEFVEEMRRRIEDAAGDDVQVQILNVTKNNSVMKTGLSIKKSNENIAPTIYMEDFFEDYKEGRPIDEIADDVIETYGHSNNVPVGIDRFADFEWVKDRIFYKVVNRESNRELLEQVPHRDIMDLAIVYAVYMGDITGSFSSVLIKNEHTEAWGGVTEEHLRFWAVENTPKILPAYVETMDVMLKRSGIDVGVNSIVPMYVVTNSARLNGATTILYDGVLSEYAERMNADLYVIPSSLHEVIIIPDSGQEDRDVMKNMIKEVNDKELEAEDILSYSLYRYDKEKGLEIVA